MTRAERLLAQHWRRYAVALSLLALAGLGIILWARIDAEQHRADQRYAMATAEADKRGTAVSILTTDVRDLRAQVKASGKTPVAPDPAQAVEHLPDRSQVPVPIPGPAGEQGQPGATGLPGAPGATGPAGAAGQDGAPGKDGRDGTNGETCPDGYSLQPLASDPDALVCRRDGAPAPSPVRALVPALVPDRRRI